MLLRLKVAGHAFRKGSVKTWTDEVYRIVGVKRTKLKYVYAVGSMSGEEILGKFDADMLKAAVEEKEDVRYKLRVVGERTRKGKTEYLVHWDGYGKRDNQWLPAEEVHEAMEKQWKRGQSVSMIGSSWMVPGTIPQAEYVLDVDSSTHVTENTSPFKFVVKVNNIASTDQAFLQLDPGCQIGLEAFIMPNNIETFRAIDGESNYSAGFYSMRIVYKDKTTHDYEVNYMKHGVFTRTDAIQEINRGLRESFLETNDKSGQVNVCGEVFTLNCFSAHVDDVSDFILLQTFPLIDDNPFLEVYAKTAKKIPQST